jgi:hypothetical protein
MPPSEVLPLWELLLGLAVLFGVLGVFGLTFAVLARKRTPRRSPLPIVVASVLLLVATVASGTMAYSKYAEAQTWSFFYYVEIVPNGNTSGAAVVPIPRNETLLLDLHVSSGNANWSLVDTPHGRGLYIGFTGMASVEASVPGLPRGFPRDEYAPSMAVNVTDYRTETWTFYSGTSGVHVHLQIYFWVLDADLAPGWSTREIGFAPPP